MSEYDLEQDHKALKKQIKQWELALDRVVDCIGDDETQRHYDCIADLESISNEMMAVNI